ncbi:MAG: LacI family DNA-binding transcriptional regulator [Spirochaetales bacterium]|nr:LacI family DNA-binding transcriptional regulator [Spirochaetales bacterium]
MAVTINDVAKKAGVSHTTVSWVIHNDPRITKKTKDKVNKAIEELNYHPNYNARSLVKGKTDAIAVVSSFFSTNFELNILRGIEDAMGQDSKGFNLNLYSSANKSNEVLNEILFGKRADAVILLCDTPSQKVINAYNKHNIPLVLVENYHDELISVKSDSISGGEAAGEYLINSGRKNIGIVVEELNGDDIPGLSQVERMIGFEKSFEKHGLTVNKDLIFEINSFRMEAGREIAQNIINNNIIIDSIFCAAGDKVALGIIDELKHNNIRVPDDISIIGFDDIDVADLVSPSLSTIRQDLHGLGSTAYDLAIKSIEKQAIDEKHIQYETFFIKRGSA